MQLQANSKLAELLFLLLTQTEGKIATPLNKAVNQKLSEALKK